MNKNIVSIIVLGLLFSNLFIIIPSEKVSAGSYNGQDLALAILSNSSWLINSSYTDKDESGHKQATVLSSLGTMSPTDGSTFALFSSGIAGVSIVTTDEENPGDERGEWFEGGQNGYPRDEATLTMTLKVPLYMHYLYYDIQFFSVEYPEYVGSEFNDRFTVTVNSPSEGNSEYYFDVNSGYFVLDSDDIPGTGFDVFAQSGNPDGLDLLDKTAPGADAGASDLITIGGIYHPVSPNETITVTINMEDVGDNLVDSAAFIDNLIFSGYAKTEISVRKIALDEDDNRITEPIECGDTVKYRITISNTGTADQDNNPGNEFEDVIPENTTYVAGSAYSEYGSIDFIEGENKIIWDGNVPSESSRVLEYEVTIDNGLDSYTVISNQGNVNWDSDEDGTNDAIEYTDDPYFDDGYDLDNDGDTDDDDATNITVVSFDYPSSVTEDFSDDPVGGNATQNYLTREWFETNSGATGNIFEVVSSYKYLTDNSYKIKLRQSGSPQYWIYNLTQLESDLEYWEAWFACGDGCEDYDLLLDYKNDLGNDIAKIKFEYVEEGTEFPMNWLLKLYYWNPSTGWEQLHSDYSGGYLRNSWYKIRIEKNGDNYINYSLYRSGIGLTDFTTADRLSAPFTDFQSVEWSSTYEPIVCPMFFWDDHTIGLI